MRSKKGSKPTTIVNATTKITGKKPKIELLPCPCGGRPEYSTWLARMTHTNKEHCVEGPEKRPREAAAAAWNAMIRTWREKAK